jgi:RNA polymerase sigma factor (sigma-70 family)
VKTRDWDQLRATFLAYRQGDKAATRAVFAELELAVKGYYRARMGPSTPEVEDLTQICLLKLHFNRDRFDGTQSLKAWVFTIASRCLIDHWRKLGARPEAQADREIFEEIAETSLPHHLQLEYGEALEKALTALKPTDRSIVYLYGVEGLSMAEIAEAVGLSEGAVKVRAHRSYVKLRERLE